MPGNFLLLAFAFGNLAMLGWLAAAAAPLLIHLWNRYRVRESPWAAMQFLRAAVQKNSRRLQLRNWLLLAVRTLVLALVVLAIAEPYGEQSLAGAAASPRHRFIVLDASYSMGHRAADRTAFARAKQIAARLVRDSHPGDVFTVIRMGLTAEVVAGPAISERATVASRIESLVEAHSPADLAGALSMIRSALSSKPVSSQLPPQREVIFITDLQRNTWADFGRLAGRTNAKADTLPALAQAARLVVIDVGQPQAVNLAVTALASAEPLITPSHDAAFDITFHQFGSEPRSQCPVELLVNGAPVGTQTIDVPADGDATLRFRHRFSSPGAHVVTVRAATDELDVDNERWLVALVRPELRVLCVAGRRDSAKYIADALNPDPKGESPLRPTVISEGDFADASLADYDGIFLDNVAQLTSSDAERLRRFAAAGGGLVFFLGDRIDPGNYNALTKPGDKTADNTTAALPGDVEPLLPARIGAVRTSSRLGLDPLDYRHPIVAPFRGRERSGLLTTPITRYFQLELPTDRPAVEVALAMPGGDPLIVSAPLGQGRVALVATDAALSSLDPQSGEPWNTWPTWPSYLPIVRELLAYATGGQQKRWQHLVGAPLAGSALADSAEMRITRPDGRTEATSIHLGPSGPEWVYNDTDLCGVYSLAGAPSDQPHQFAMNLDARESDLAKMPIDQLPPQVGIQTSWRDSTSSPSPIVLRESSWNVPLLWGTLFLMFLEPFLAWRIGRGPK